MKKNQIITIILSLLFAGLGHIYNDKFLKGIVLSFLQFLLLLLLVGTLGILGLPAIVLAIYSIYDSYKITKKNQEKIKVSAGYIFRFLFAILLFVFYVDMITSTYLAYVSPPIEESEVISEIQNYLHDKYEKDFVVSKIEYIPAIEEYNMTAYPIDDPNLTFNVSKKNYSREIEENYLSEKWSREAELFFETMIKQFFPDNFRFNIYVEIQGNHLELVPHDIQYQDLRKSNAKELKHTITIYTVQYSEPFNKSTESDRVYKFIKLLKKNNILNASLDIKYYNTSLKQLLSKDGKMDPYNKKIDDYLSKRFFMSTIDFETVKEPKDIENIFNF